jgi:hypothetical protein
MHHATHYHLYPDTPVICSTTRPLSSGNISLGIGTSARAPELSFYGPREQIAAMLRDALTALYAPPAVDDLSCLDVLAGADHGE